MINITPLRNDVGIIIGYVEEDPYRIQYRSLKYGVISHYDKQTKIYYRQKLVPGKPSTSIFGDMGESDLRYWGG